MLAYNSIFAETMRLWRGDGGILAATDYVASQLESVSPAELGRTLTLLGCCYKRQELWAKAERSLHDALSVSCDPVSRAGALCELLDLCVSGHQVEDGMRYGFDLDLVFRAGTDADEFKAPYHHNMGRLLLVAGDALAAVPHLKAASALFKGTDRINEGLMVDVSAAKALLRIGKPEEAESLCRNALANANSPYVLVEANLTMERITALRGDLIQAERHIDRATKIHAESIDKKDYRVFLNILLAEADLAEFSGETVTARRLRALVERRASAGRIRIDEEVTA